MPEVPIGDMLPDGRFQVRPLATRGEVAIYIYADGKTRCVTVSPEEAEMCADMLHSAAVTAHNAERLYVPCSICGEQPDFSAHDGSPKSHPYLTGPL